MLNLTTRKVFGIFKDPFTDDVMTAGDVYLNDGSRFAAEYLFQTAKAGACWPSWGNRVPARAPSAVLP
jgi:hypothetical protein